MRRACRNTPCGMNGMASEASERACRTSVPRLASLCSLLPRTRLGRDEMKKKKTLSAVTAASQLLLDETVPRWTETNAGPHPRSALKPQCGCV